MGRVLSEAAVELGVETTQADTLASALRILIEQQGWFEDAGRKTPGELLRVWLGNSDIQRFLEVHRFEDVLWYNQERFEMWIWWLAAQAVLSAATGPKASTSLLVERVILVHGFVQKVSLAEGKSAFQVTRLLDALK